MSGRSLATVLFTDIVRSTEHLSELGDRSWKRLLERHDRLLVRCIVEHEGRVVNTTGDGFVAVFDRPGSAIECAHAVVRKVETLGVSVRAGVHTGEFEVRGDDIAGIAVNVAARVSALAAASEVLVTGTVRDLLSGGEFTLEPRGTVTLRGIPGRRAVLAALPHPTTPRSTQGRRSRRAVSVLVVDDHPLWRRTLRHLLERAGFAVKGEAGTAAEAVLEAGRLDPDVVVIDLDMPGGHGTEAIAILATDRHRCSVLVLSSSDERDDVVRAVRCGAKGYLLKTADEADIRDAIGRVARGELVFPPALARVVLDELRTPAPTAPGVVVVAARPLQRRGLAATLAESGHAVRDAVDGHPCVVVLHLAGGEGDDGLVAEAASWCPPALGVVVVVDDRRHARAAGSAVGRGHGLACLVSPDEDDLVAAVRRVAAGEVFLDADAASALAPSPSRLASLTERELEVLRLMADGLGNQAIARTAHLSAKTVEAHINSIFTKLGLEAASDDHRRVRAVVAFLDAASRG